MFKWRPILRGIATLEEYDRHYSLVDLCDANEALDLMDEQEAWAAQEQAKGAQQPHG